MRAVGERVRERPRRVVVAIFLVGRDAKMGVVFPGGRFSFFLFFLVSISCSFVLFFVRFVELEETLDFPVQGYVLMSTRSFVC